MRGWVLIAGAFGLLAASGTAQQPRAPVDPWLVPPAYADPMLDPLTADALEPFAGEAAYRDWLKGVYAYATDRLKRIAEEVRQRQPKPANGLKPINFWKISQQQDEEFCTDPECLYPEESESDSIVVTGTRAGTSSSRAPSSRARATRPGAAAPNITNVQTAGVDEGDVVKQIGDFLAVLQDGRIFVVDIRQGRLRLSDRINVYTSKSDWAWYDEMLVEGDRIIVTAYSYGRQATEISVFRLDQRTGELARDGRFFINSYDYYSGENYASRIVGDNLVLYTLYNAALVLNDSGGPKLWRWMDDDERRVRGRNTATEDRAGGRSLIDAGSVYRPVLRTQNPMIHVVTVCPLRSYSAGALPACRVSAFAGPPAREFFVSPSDVYLWTGEPAWQADDDWEARRARCLRGDVGHGRVAPAAVYRVPIDGGAPRVVGMRGAPIDQFSMDMTNETFRILTRWREPGCDANAPNPTLVYANIGLDEFSSRFRAIDARRHVLVPAPAAGVIENRFADDWLVYGARVEGYGAIPDRNRPESPLFVLPVERPDETRRLALPHNVIRIERVGADRIAVGGYRDVGGLDLSLVQLARKPSVLDTLRLRGRFESEGRSHAFNSLVEDDGSGLLGVPTVLRRSGGGRFVWNSEGSDVSFLRMAPSGRLADAGALEQLNTRPAPGYSCEVSCIDWYGNSRPIFTDGRIFALMATEIAEGRMGKNRITEVRRLNLTQRKGRRPGIGG